MKALAELEIRRRQIKDKPFDLTIEQFIARYFDFINKPFSNAHKEILSWVNNIREEKSTEKELFAILPRGFGKSTLAEIACVYLALANVKSYILYICSNQELADKHLTSISMLLENERLERDYPEFTNRKLSKYGHSRGWRRNRLVTNTGVVFDAAGLESLGRGIKFGDQRPNLVVLDDIDLYHDTQATTLKKEQILVNSIIPSGSVDLNVLGVQNLIKKDGIFGKIAEHKSDYFIQAKIVGPIKAVDGLTIERRENGYAVTDGTSTWDGFTIDDAEALINSIGPTAFLHENQHEITTAQGMFKDIVFKHIELDAVPTIVKYSLCIDPAITSTDSSDSNAIQLDGKGKDGKIYRFYSWQKISSPKETLLRAIAKAVEYKINVIGIETNQGGDTWLSVFREALAEYKESEIARVNNSYHGIILTQALGRINSINIVLRQDKAPSNMNKVARANLMLADYESGNIIHVIGTHDILEQSLKQFPVNKPFDLVDAAYWSWKNLNTNSWLID